MDRLSEAELESLRARTADALSMVQTILRTVHDLCIAQDTLLLADMQGWQTSHVRAIVGVIQDLANRAEQMTSGAANDFQPDVPF